MKIVNNFDGTKLTAHLSNFSYLKQEFPILYNIGQAAELNLHNVLVTCRFKLRQFSEKFIRNIERRFQKAYIIKSKFLKSKIDNLPQAILQKAFKGELVPQDPNDEPASVLLERIKREKEKGGKKG